jgi:hypothetical protein
VGSSTAVTSDLRPKPAHERRAETVALTVPPPLTRIPPGGRASMSSTTATRPKGWTDGIAAGVRTLRVATIGTRGVIYLADAGR